MRRFGNPISLTSSNIEAIFSKIVPKFFSYAENSYSPPTIRPQKKTPLDAAFSFSSRQRLQHQRRNPASDEQRHVVVEEGRDDCVLDVVVLAVSVKAHCRAEGGVGGG